MGTVWIHLLTIVAVWRISTMIAYEDGPWWIFYRLQKRFDGRWIGDLLDCPRCISVWVSIPAALVMGVSWYETICLAFFYSGASMFIENIFARLEAFRAGYSGSRIRTRRG